MKIVCFMNNSVYESFFLRIIQQLLKPQGGLLLDKILSIVQHILSRGGINVERDFLS